MTDLIRLRGEALSAEAIVDALKSDAAVIAERVLPPEVLDPLRAEVEGSSPGPPSAVTSAAARPSGRAVCRAPPPAAGRW